MIMDPEAFGPWLDAQLRRAASTQTELADALGVTRAAVSAWVNGRAMPRADKVRAIEQYLGLSAGAAASPVNAYIPTTSLTWYHRPAHDDGGRELGNAANFAFDVNLGVVAREATQNSLDERHDTKRPVRVRYTLHEITGERLQRFLQLIRWPDLKPHYEAAARQDQKAGRVFREGLRLLDEEERLLLLRIDDYNANGLTGSDYAEDRFAAVVRDQLNSFKSGTTKDTAGGSYGLGKATFWATSQLGMVLMNSTLSESHEGRTARRMVGRIDLPWREVNDEAWAGPAWFGEPEERRRGATRSWWGDEATAEALYLERENDDPGTSFLIVGAYDGSGDLDSSDLEQLHGELMKRLAQDFWAAMIAERGGSPRLRVSVAAYRDGETVVPDRLVNPQEQLPVLSRAMEAFLNGETVPELKARTEVARTAVKLRLPKLREGKSAAHGVSGAQEHEAVLLLTPTEEDDPTPNQLVCMRGNRMVVLQQRVGDLPLGARPFQAVLLAGTATCRSDADALAAERFLRAAEPPDHNDWRSTEDVTALYVRGARQRLIDFKREMKDAVRALLRGPEEEQQQDDGPSGLRDRLRLDPPKPKRTQSFPTVEKVTGGVDDEGAWQVRVTVKLPDREDPWVLEPKLWFATRSGPKLPAEWSLLQPEDGCEKLSDSSLKFTAGGRAVFSGVSDAASHPVSAWMARIEVDVQRAKESTR